MSFPEMPLPDTVDCVTRYLGGERLAFDTVYHFYKNQLLQVARRYHRDLATAEDAVQWAFEKGVASLGTWRREKPIGFWLRSICAHVCLNELERQKRAPVATDAVVLDAGGVGSKEDAVLRTEREWMTRLLEEGKRKNALGDLLTRLSPEENQIVVLFHLEHRTHDEIAGRLKITSANCRKKLERALRKLRAVADPALQRDVQELA